MAGSILKPPPEVSPTSEYVTPGPFTSADEAVMPTSVLTAAPSATVLAAALASTGAEGATSVTLIVKVCEVVTMPSLACAVTL